MKTKTKSKQTAIFQYKCRRCGEIVNSRYDCAADIAENMIIANNFDHQIPEFIFHTCNGDVNLYKKGIADLIGYVTINEN